MCFSLSFLAGGERGKIPLIPPAPGSQIYAQRLRLGWAAAVCGRRGRRARRWARRRMVPIASRCFPLLPIGSQRSRPHPASSARGATGVWGAPVDRMGWGEHPVAGTGGFGVFVVVRSRPLSCAGAQGWDVGDWGNATWHPPGTHLAPTLPGWLCSPNPSPLAPSAASAQRDPHAAAAPRWSWGPEPPRAGTGGAAGGKKRDTAPGREAV